MELTRDVRTLFVSEIQIKCRKKDLKRFFEKTGGVKVNDIQLIVDEKTGRSKGLAYVELRNLDDLPKALALNGRQFVWKSGKLGFPITIRASEAEKNYQHEQAKNQVAAAAAAAGPPSRKVIVKNLPTIFTAADVETLFKPVGELDGTPTVLTGADSTSIGHAIVEFKSPDDANTAVAKINNYEILEKRLSVELVPNPVVVPPVAAGLPIGALAGGVGSAALGLAGSAAAGGIAALMGVGSGAAAAGFLQGQAPITQTSDSVTMEFQPLSATSRQHLMAKLANSRGMGGAQYASGANSIPLGVRQQPPAPPASVPVAAPAPALTAPIGTPSACLVLKNMFNAAEEAAENGENWNKLIEEDVTNECSKHGTVKHCHVDVDSNGFVYVMLESDEAGAKVS
mgnify:CR=1 FL=1